MGYESLMLDYQRLEVWRRATTLATSAYDLASHLPATETYEMGRQLRTAAISVSSNIAEGAGRGSTKDFKRFLRIAMGSCNEVESLTLVSITLGLASQRSTQRILSETSEIRRMLLALIRRTS